MIVIITHARTMLQKTHTLEILSAGTIKEYMH